MYGKLLFVAGAAVGYVVGTRRGRRDYETVKRKASEFWLDPRVQKAATRAGDFVGENVPVVGEKLSDAVDSVTSAARKTTSGRSDAGSSETTGATSSSPGASAGRTPGPPASAAG
jgi:hypothetical protein